jgi:hypothetical protein
MNCYLGGDGMQLSEEGESIGRLTTTLYPAAGRMLTQNQDGCDFAILGTSKSILQQGNNRLAWCGR